MRVPTRKPDKYTFKEFDPNITEAKFLELQKELEGLKTKRQKAIIETKRLAEMGDFSENYAYSIAKGKLRGINNRMTELDYIINHSNIIKPKHKGIIELGSKVTVLVDDKKKTYIILGPSETNPEKGIISYKSPLGQALMGHKNGDIVKVGLKNKEVEYEIINIE